MSVAGVYDTIYMYIIYGVRVYTVQVVCEGTCIFEFERCYLLVVFPCNLHHFIFRSTVLTTTGHY